MSIFNGKFYEALNGRANHLTCRKCNFSVITCDNRVHSPLEGECVDSVDIAGAGGLRELKARKLSDDSKAYFRAPVFYKLPGEPTVDVFNLLKNHPKILSREDGLHLVVSRHVGDTVLSYINNNGYADFTLDEYLHKIYKNGDSSPLIQLS